MHILTAVHVTSWLQGELDISDVGACIMLCMCVCESLNFLVMAAIASYQVIIIMLHIHHMHIFDLTAECFPHIPSLLSPPTKYTISID